MTATYTLRMAPEIQDRERRADALVKRGARYVIESDIVWTDRGVLLLSVHPYDARGVMVGILDCGDETADRVVEVRAANEVYVTTCNGNLKRMAECQFREVE